MKCTNKKPAGIGMYWFHGSGEHDYGRGYELDRGVEGLGHYFPVADEFIDICGADFRNPIGIWWGPVLAPWEATDG